MTLKDAIEFNSSSRNLPKVWKLDKAKFNAQSRWFLISTEHGKCIGTILGCRDDGVAMIIPTSKTRGMVKCITHEQFKQLVEFL